jgi:hypothetical protein
MSFLSTFLKPRIKVGTQPKNTYVQGEVFNAGAEVFAYETTVGNPTYLNRVFPQWNFTPLEVFQPPMNAQLLALPPSGPQGFAYGGMQPTGLMDPASYPDIAGDYYQ